MPNPSSNDKTEAGSATLGPWEVGTRRPYIVGITSNTFRHDCVVTSGKPTGGYGWPAITLEERKANAALFARAPALLRQNAELVTALGLILARMEIRELAFAETGEGYWSDDDKTAMGAIRSIVAKCQKESG